MPPSAETVCAVTKRAASLASHATTSATSSGLAHRPSGVSAVVEATASGMVLLRAHRSVSTTPGATALTRMPRGARSIASERVIESSAALLAP